MHRPRSFLATKLLPKNITTAREKCTVIKDGIKFCQRVTTLKQSEYEQFMTRNLSFLQSEEEQLRFSAIAGNCYGLLDRIETYMSSVCKVAERPVPPSVDPAVKTMWKSHCVQGRYTEGLAAALNEPLKKWIASVEQVQKTLAEADDTGEYSDLSAYSSSSDEEYSDDSASSSST